MLKKFFLYGFILQLGTMSFLEHGLFGELFKIKELVSHYVNEHDEAENVWDFVYNHYWGQASNELDHEAFPFQNIHIHNYNIWMNCIAVHVPQFIVAIPNQQWHLQESILLDLYESKGIWQPPGA
ncbi:MAG: hypothetical protein RL609_1217 [Bacteroidota bacterium]|jgi:hypothetical protein